MIDKEGKTLVHFINKKGNSYCGIQRNRTDRFIKGGKKIDIKEEYLCVNCSFQTLRYPSPLLDMYSFKELVASEINQKFCEKLSESYHSEMDKILGECATMEKDHVKR